MNFFRELVSGQKVRFNNGQYNLDLTYITQRVIAMSFPAQGFESTYRNNIDDVAKFLYEHHGNQYKLFNLSNRTYDYNKFGDRIEAFTWEDHHSPPIDMLFDVCKKVDDFLQKEINNVAIIHCQAGKGRTGTLICCYLLYSGRAQTVDEARLYYSKKRFNKAKSGVTQPSQVRYIQYFYNIFRSPNHSPQVKVISSIQFVGTPPKISGLKPYIDIYCVRDQKKLYSGLKDAQTKQYEYKSPNFILPVNNLEVYGDILIKFHQYGSLRSKFLFRLAFNTCMIDDSNVLVFNLSNLDPDSTQKDKRYNKDFEVHIQFQSVCEKCHIRQFLFQKCELCQNKMQVENKGWELVYDVMRNYPKYTINDSKILLYGDPDYDDFNEVIREKSTIDVESDNDSEKDEEEDKNADNIQFNQ